MEMMNLTDVKAHLSAVVDRVLQGEDIIISRQGKPVAVVTPYAPAKIVQRTGFMNGQIKIADDFDGWPDDIAAALGMKD